MTKKMLINATQSDELRVALVDTKNDSPKLDDLDVERTDKTQTKASIFKGIVTRVEPSLEAAFINFGSARHGFLPIKEVARQYFHENANYEHGKPHIKDVLKPGQEIIVQVDKEERGTKGAALTTFISLAGCYLVLMPNNPRAGGISRRIEGDERDDLKDVLSQLPVPDGMGLIVRTAGVGRSLEELQWDLDVLLTQWQAIQNFADNNNAPCLIYRDSDVVVRAIRDYLRPDIDEIIVDTESAFQRVQDHLNLVRPDFVNRLKLYQQKTPMFSSYEVETQIESAYQREIALDNGASIVIDHTEALIAIDINSAKATEGSDIEETALQTNLAAATEIARQLRLRDIGGLIVIDFIDMNVPRHQRMVENRLRDEFKQDRARIQMGRISRFGLMEMSRQRLRPALGETTQITCPRCNGQGNIRGIPSVSMAIIRVIEEEVMKHHTAQINIQVPIEVASYLVNEKRSAIAKLEEAYQVAILIIPNKHFESPHYEYQRIKKDDSQHKKTPSYKQVTQPQNTVAVEPAKTYEAPKAPETMVSQITPKAPAPSSQSSKASWIKRIVKAVFGSSEETTAKKSRSRSDNQGQGQHRHQQRKGGGNRHRHGRRDNRKRHSHNRRNHSGNKHQDSYKGKPRQNQQNYSNQDSSERYGSQQSGQQRDSQQQEHRANGASRQQRERSYGQSRSDNNQQQQHHQESRQPKQQRYEERKPPAEVKQQQAAPVEPRAERPQQQAAPEQQRPVHVEPVNIVNKEPKVAEVSPEEKAKQAQKEAARKASLNQTSFTQLSDAEKQSAYVAPVEKTQQSQSSEQFKQVVSKGSTYDEKPLELPTIAQQPVKSQPAPSNRPEEENSES